MLFLLIMLIIFLLRDNSIVVLLALNPFDLLFRFSPFGIIKRMIVFHDLNYVLKHKHDVFFLFSMQNINSNCYIIFRKFFPVMFFWLKIYSFSVIVIYKWFNFCYSLRIIFDFFMINSTVTAYRKHLLSFVLVGFIVVFYFYPVRRIYRIKLDLLTFKIQ